MLLSLASVGRLVIDFCLEDEHGNLPQSRLKFDHVHIFRSLSAAKATSTSQC